MDRHAPDASWSFDFFDDESDVEDDWSFGTAEGFDEVRARRRPSEEALRRIGLLAAAVAVFVFVAVLIVSLASGGGEGGADRAYAARLAQPAQDSQAVGAMLANLLTGSPSSYARVESALSRMLRRQQHDGDEAEAIVPPPRLRGQYQPVLDVLQLRARGLAALLAAVRGASTGSTEIDWATGLSMGADRLVASDVIWQDVIAKALQAQFARDGAAGVAAPQSTFLSNFELASSGAMTRFLDKLRSPKTATGLTVQTGLLKSGDTGSPVVAWQKELNKWLSRQPGSSTLKASGTFDQATTTATMAFQTAEHLAADGVVGPATRAALAEALAR